MNTICFNLFIALTILSVKIEGKHVCDRACVKGQSMTCHYDFQFHKYFTMSKACFNCPLNVTDCHRPTCVAANGVPRIFYTANLQLPGPLIAICQNDTLVVNVNNRLVDLITTIHWHGITQIGTQYMDGVPYVTQCPIIPYDQFQYYFRVYQSGTFFWHSHVSYQILDGLAGMLVIRQPPGEDPNQHTYNFDLSDHVMLISDWSNVTGGVLDSLHYTVLNDLPFIPAITINGRGQQQVYKNSQGENVYTPLSQFQVESGYRYRFRICSNVNSECPSVFSIDGHSMTIIATDGNPVVPYEVDAIEMGQGERYDFVLNANYTTGNFWIRIQGRGKMNFCSGSYTGANLMYKGSKKIDLTHLYTPQKPPLRNSQIMETVANITSLTPYAHNLNVKDVQQFYFSVGDLPNFNPLFYNPKYYPWSSFNSSFQIPLPLVNLIAFTNPPSPLLTQFHQVPKEMLCDEQSLKGVKNCSNEFCSCVHLVKIPLGKVAEMVIIDVGNDTGYHSFHLHGYTFRVLAQGSMIPGQNTVQHFKELDKQGKIHRKLTGAAFKDSVMIPYQGYTIFRFYADNPGFWLFHCHMTFHFESGMGLVVQVGEPSQFPKFPKNLPKCGNYEYCKKHKRD